MARVTGHDEVAALLGAYALDAVDPDEAAAIEAHLESCPRCRDELRNHREVTGWLSYAGQEAPPGLWDKVMVEVRGDQAPPAGSGPAVVGPSPARRRPVGRDWVIPVVAAAAVVIVALLAIQVTRLQNRTDHLSREISQMANQPTMATVNAALAVPGARQVTLRPATGSAPSVDAVILPDGAGYLYHATLEPLPAAQTYQLWGESNQKLISYGLIGASPAPVTAFRAGIPVQALAITIEVAGGVVAPTQSPLVSGSVS